MVLYQILPIWALTIDFRIYMKLIQILLILFSTTFFISCGDSTTSSPIADVASISLDDTNISIHSTDLQKALTATATYTDGTTANATADLTWNSSENSTLLTAVGSVFSARNGGDANLTIEYANTFYDTQNVHIKKLISIEHSDINISDIGTAQTVYLGGTFENNETNVSLQTNIRYVSDANSTITDVNATQFTLTVDYNSSSILIQVILFENTDNQQDDINITFN